MSSKKDKTYDDALQDSSANTVYDVLKEQTSIQERPLQMVFAGSHTPQAKPKSTFFWTSIIAAVFTVLQWILTMLSVVNHWKFSLGSNQTQTYYEAPNAVSNPSLIAPGMPQACLNWLKGNNVNTIGLLKMDYDARLSVLVTTIQFALCTLAFVQHVYKHFKNKGWDKYMRTYSMLKISAAATLASLGIAALVTGVSILVTVVLKSEDVHMSYTNNLNVTGGCTFATVNMNKRWGYWDVEYELPYRVAMAVLGAA